MRWTRSGELKPRNLLWRIRRVMLAGGAMSVLVASAAGAKVWSDVNVPTLNPRPERSLVCDASVQVCDSQSAFAEIGSAEAGESVRFEQIPEVMIQALIAAEDRDFRRHQGVDPAGIARALWIDLRGGSQGGSTITQQLIKNVTGQDQKSISRKVSEAIQAMKIEREHSKNEIITYYLNSIYFGRNAQGIAAAVRAYFGPDARVEDIDLPKAAYLAALIREPEDVDANLPDDDPERDEQRRYATVRRKHVLDAMLEEHYITPSDRDQVAEMGWDYVLKEDETQKTRVRKHQDIGGIQWATYIREWIKHNIPTVTAQELDTGGLRIYSSMDPVLQRMAKDAVQETLPTAPPEVHAALASYDDNGFLRAMLPSRDPAGIEFNYARAPNQPGSSFKPLVLAQYLQNEGKYLDDPFDNPDKITIGSETCESVEGEATPEPIDVAQATVISSNTVYCQLLEQTSNQATMDLARKFGLTDDNFISSQNPVDNPLLAIGNPVQVSTVLMASVYSTFANGGQKVGPSPVLKITRANGTILWEASAERLRILEEDIAGQVNHVLSRVVSDERGTGFKQGRVPGQIVAGKSGSVSAGPGSKDNTDAWFVGYTCKLTAAVWMGKEKGTDTIGSVEGVFPVNGGTLPARIFSNYMAKATQGKTSCPFDRPPGSFPPTTVPPTTDWRPRWPWERGRDRDEEPQPGEETSTTRRWGFPLPTVPSPDETTTTRRNGGGPGGGRPTTTTTLFDFPGGGPGGPGGGGREG